MQDDFGLDDIERERHEESFSPANPPFGPEASVTFPHGFSIRTPAYPDEAVYVRVCAPDGGEIAYFDQAEFSRDAAGTLSTLIAHLDRDVTWPLLEVKTVQDVGDNPYRLMPGELRHRNAVNGNEYGEETMFINVSNGFSLVVTVDAEIDYVRVCDPGFGETAYWSIDEVAEDPSDVIGAMFGALVRGQ